jgi:23S rRNA pseudouridine1911/1915/1917 synthase
MARINDDWKVEHEGALAAEVKRHLVLSVRQAKGLIDAGCVKVNGEVVSKHGHRLASGDSVHANFDPALKYDLAPSKTQLKEDPYEVLFEDKHLLFVNKPAGLLTVPTEGGKEATLADAITEHYQRRGFKRFHLFIVHRLDRFTSGVLVFAKTPEALSGLKKMFDLHTLNRVYKAILAGELPENSGTLKGHLIEQVKTLKMRVVDPKKKHSEGAKAAVTHYRVVERLPGHTVVEVRLETGRRNQIRVQFADRGFPLLGDQVYGEASELLDRQALHAELLGFKHPVTDEQITVSAPLPKDMAAVLKALRAQARLTRASEGVKGEEGIYKPTQSKEDKHKRVKRALRYADSAPARDARGPRREREDRKPRRDFEDRPGRPRRPEGDRDERPRRSFRDQEERPPRDARPRREGPAEDRPKRPFRPRPEEGGAERPRRTFGDRPARPRREEDGGRPERPRASRPEGRREDRPKRPYRAEGSERPARTGGGSGAKRSGKPAFKPKRKP